MTLSVITGTLSNEFEFRDPWGEFEKLVSQGYFIKQYWTGTRWLQSTKKKVYTWNGKRGSIIQTTGSGKTILAMLRAYEAHSKHIITGGNLKIGWTENNEGKPKGEWNAVITSMGRLQKTHHMHITLDDIRGTITSWNTSTADMVVELANSTRKKGDRIDITTQRMKFVPPDMRDIIDEVYVPFIRAYDTTRYAPDGRWTPAELLSLHFSSGYEFLDAKIYNLTTPTARYVLDNFDTLQIAESLGEADTAGEGAPRTNQPGYALEVKALEFLKERAPGINWQHLNGKNVFDIISDTHAIDIVGTDPDGGLNLDHKDLLKHIRTANIKGQKPYLMFERAGKWCFVVITHNLNDLVSGKKINPAHLFKNRFRTIDNL